MSEEDPWKMLKRLRPRNKLEWVFWTFIVSALALFLIAVIFDFNIWPVIASVSFLAGAHIVMLVIETRNRATYIREIKQKIDEDQVAREAQIYLLRHELGLTDDEDV